MLGLQTAVVIDCHSGHKNTRLRDLMLHEISSPDAFVLRAQALAVLHDAHSNLDLRAHPSAGQHGLFIHIIQAV